MVITRHLALAVVVVVLSGCAQVKQVDIADANERGLAGELVLIPGGTFMMGDMSGDGFEGEQPVHEITVPTFRMGKYEVTFAQWDACVADGECNDNSPDDEGWGRGNLPVIHISWHDVQLFIDWLNSKTSGGYRLPSEAEWEYAARAGSATKYHFGDDESQLCRYANHADTSTDNDWWNEACIDGVSEGTAEVGRYQPNEFGLYDMHGNVHEWVEDRWHVNYEGAPSDGSVWEGGCCDTRVIRGGAWSSGPEPLRSAFRYWLHPSAFGHILGFRLAQDLHTDQEKNPLKSQAGCKTTRPS